MSVTAMRGTLSRRKPPNQWLSGGAWQVSCDPGRRPDRHQLSRSAFADALQPDRCTTERQALDNGCRRVRKAALVQARAAEGFQIVLAVGVPLPRQLVCDPGQRDVGLRAAQLLQRSGCDLRLAGHAGGHRQYPVGAAEIAALTDRLARKSDSLLVVSSDKLRVGGDSV